MEEIIKGFLGMFFVVMLLVIGVGLIGMAAYGRAAARTADAYAAAIENSNYAKEVTEECRQAAAIKGYQMAITTYDEENPYGQLQLSYTYGMPLLGISIPGSACACLN